MKLMAYSRVTAVLKLKSGLHIGTGEKEARGEPAPVLKSMITGLPFLPGSSLKGKMRSLLEMRYGADANKPGDPCSCGSCSICALFGSASDKTTNQPSRIIFRDIVLKEGPVKDKIEENGLEIKPGVRINRSTGKAAQGALFPAERVPEGSEFNFVLSVRVFDTDSKQAVQNWLMAGLYLLEQDALGGSGTRGSGWVEMNDLAIDGVKIEDWRAKAEQVMPTLDRKKGIRP